MLYTKYLHKNKIKRGMKGGGSLLGCGERGKYLQGLGGKKMRERCHVEGIGVDSSRLIKIDLSKTFLP
jgi:hypothetical protein